MFPATPTALPPGVQMVTVSSTDWRIWAFADDAITLWNIAPNSAITTFQIVIILAVLTISIFLLIKWLNRLTADDKTTNE